MLYDNAQLARVYLHAWQVTGNEFFRTLRLGDVLGIPLGPGLIEDLERFVFLVYNAPRYWVCSGLSRKRNDGTPVAFLPGTSPGHAGWGTRHEL
jgi:hypothetical protein